MRWLQERTFPVTGLILAVAACYLLSFIEEEHVPINITFAASVLFTLFLMVVLFIAFLTLLLLAPTLVLFTQFGPQSNSRLVNLLNGRGNRFARCLLTIAWLVSLMFIGIGFLVALSIYQRCIDPWPGILIFVILILLTLVLAARLFVKIVAVIYPLPQVRRKSFSLAPGWLIFNMFLQFLLVYAIFFIITKIFGDSGSVWFFMEKILPSVILVGLVQIGAAMFIGTLIRANGSFSLAGAAVAFISLVALLGMYPPSGSWITTQVLQTTASGARPCAVLSWTTDAEKQFESLRNSTDRRKTKPLYIFAVSDGQYLVRDHDSRSKRIDFIPSSFVTGIDNDCSHQQPRAATQ